MFCLFENIYKNNVLLQLLSLLVGHQEERPPANS